MAKNQDNKFTCDECSVLFEVGNGSFIGSLDDFEFIITKGDIENEITGIECSPFLQYVQLCANCHKNRNTND